MPELSRLVLEIDDKGIVTANGNLDLFKKKSEEAAKAATGIEKSNKANAKSFDLVNQLTNLNTLAMGAANLAVLKFANSMVEAAGKMEAIKTQLQVVTGSAKIADSTFRDLQQFAARTPFSIEGITDTAIQLMQVGVQAKDLQETLTMLGDVSGGSQDKLNRIMMNYTQILSVGKASTMDIRQFAQANLPIYQELANVTGKSGEALQDMITNGEITGEVVTEAFRRMTAEGGKFFNGMGLAAETYQGKLSTMKDSVSNLAAKFGELWLLNFQKTALDAITKVSDAAANALDKNMFGKKAFDTFENDYLNSSFDQREYVANEQIKFWLNRSQMLKRAGLDYQSDPEYQDAIKQLNEWYDYLDKITNQEAVVIRGQREAEAAAEAAAAASKVAAEAARGWQEALKKALDLEEVSTGSQAVTDYIDNIETSLNGSLAYAQAFGGKVTDIYDDYATRVKKAVKELLQSGFWTLDEATIQRLISFANRLETAGGGTSSAGFSNPQFGYSQDPAFMNQGGSPFALSPFGSETGFNVQFSESDALWLDEERVRKEEEQAARLGEIYRNLGEQLKQFAADATFDALWTMGEALYEGGNAAEAFGKSLAKSILQNVPAMLFQTGFQMAITGNVYGGLALMALSGLGAVAGGYLTKGLDGADDGDEKAKKLETLTNQLAELITQSKADAEYFATGLRSRNAQYLNSTVSVNDAIITKQGQVIQTHPDDYLIATKTPGYLGGGGGRVVINVNNTISNEANVDIQEKENADGTKELFFTVRKLIKSDMARGEYDAVLASRQPAIAGRGKRVSQ